MTPTTKTLFWWVAAIVFGFLLIHALNMIEQDCLNWGVC